MSKTEFDKILSTDAATLGEGSDAYNSPDTSVDRDSLYSICSHAMSKASRPKLKGDSMVERLGFGEGIITESLKDLESIMSFTTEDWEKLSDFSNDE